MHVETNVVYGMISGLALLCAAGVSVRFRRVPGAGHGPGIVADPEIGAAIQAEIVAWFDEHLIE